jgi:hypothetical protein
MKPVNVSELRVDLAVVYLGEQQDQGVIDPALRAIGMALYPGHPGRVWRTPIQHVQVIWVGVEEEPASYAVGFTVDDITDVTVPGLGLLSEDEYERRSSVIREAMANGPSMFGWKPPWITGGTVT